MSIHIIIQTKGGVGKSTIAFNILPILVNNNYEIYEIDNNNQTAKFYNKSQSLSSKTRTVSLNLADKILDDIFYDTLVCQDKDVIIDAGGGDDTSMILNMLELQDTTNVIYYIPLKSGEDNYNALQTYNKLPKDANIIFVLNGYIDKNNITEEFLYFFGDKEQDVIGLIEQINKKVKYICIPFSNLFNISKLSYNLTLLDLAKMSEGISLRAAQANFMEKTKKDKTKYLKLNRRFKNSLLANKLIKQIKEDLKISSIANKVS